MHFFSRALFLIKQRIKQSNIYEKIEGMVFSESCMYIYTYIYIYIHTYISSLSFLSCSSTNHTHHYTSLDLACLENTWKMSLLEGGCSIGSFLSLYTHFLLLIVRMNNNCAALWRLESSSWNFVHLSLCSGRETRSCFCFIVFFPTCAMRPD